MYKYYCSYMICANLNEKQHFFFLKKKTTFLLWNEIAKTRIEGNNGTENIRVQAKFEASSH